MDRDTLGEVCDGSGDSRGGLAPFVGSSGGPRRVGDPRGGAGRVEGPLGRSGKGYWTVWEVRDMSVDPWGGLGRIRGP